MSDYVVVPVSIIAQMGTNYLGWDDDDWSYDYGDPIKLKQAKLELRSALDLAARFLKQTGAVRISDHYFEEAQGPGLAWVVERRFASTLCRMALPTVDADGAYSQIPIEGDVASGLQQKPIRWILDFHSFRFEGPAAMSFFEIDECFDHLFGSMSDTYGFASTPDRLPEPGEPADAWAARVAVDGEALIDAMDLFDECGKDLEVYLALSPSQEETAFQWVMPGLFLRGTVTTVVGDSGIGKSTMLGEFCAMAGSQSKGELTFLGQPIEGGRNCVVFSGEENTAILHNRLNRFKGAEHGLYRRCVLLPAADKDIDECLAFFKRVPWQVDVVIVDPALKFLRDENSADAVSQLYDKLNQLAAEANCAVILVHHMRKGHVQRFDQMRGAIRGASAFVDRPRIVIGMRKRGPDLVEIGMLKSNIPPSEQTWGEVGKARLFRQNRETMRLDPVDGPSSTSTSTSGQDRQNSAELERWVLDTVRASTAKGWEVRKTGRKSLYQGQLASGGAYSRQAIERAQEALIATGRLLDTEHGLRVADPAPAD